MLRIRLSGLMGVYTLNRSSIANVRLRENDIADDWWPNASDILLHNGAAPRMHLVIPPIFCIHVSLSSALLQVRGDLQTEFTAKGKLVNGKICDIPLVPWYDMGVGLGGGEIPTT